MEKDLNITPDQLEEPILNEGKVNVNLTLYDNQLEEMASRSSLYQHISETQNADVSFADLLADDSTTLQAYTDFYPDKPPETTLSLQSDTYGWCDFVVPTTDTEKNQLKAGLEDVASREHTSADAMMYEVFKEEWIADHIDDAAMTATEALYENSEESTWLTFEQYVQEYGFEDGSVLPSFAEFLENDYTERPAEQSQATVQVRNMLVNEDGNLFATMEVNRSRMEEMLNDANSPLLKGKDIHELVYFNDAASPVLAAEINRDESVQAFAIMRDGYEEIEVPLSLDDNTIAEIKDAVKENVEQSLDVSVQHFFETAEPNHNYSQEEVHALAETVGKFVTAYQEYQEPEKEYSLEKNIQRIEEGLTSPEILPRLTAELDKAIDVSQRTTSEGIFLLPDRIVEQAVEVAQQMEMYTKPLEFEKSETVQFDSEVVMDNETADSSAEWHEVKMDISNTVNAFFENGGVEPAISKDGAFTVAKSPEGEAVQLIDNDLKMPMAEMTPTNDGYVIQHSINAVVKEGLENGLNRAGMAVSQETQKEASAPEKKHKQSIERD